MWKDFATQLVAVLSSLAAAGFWFWSAMVPIPDSQDAFIAALQHASKLSAYGALAAAIAAVFVAIGFIREWLA